MNFQVNLISFMFHIQQRPVPFSLTGGKVQGKMCCERRDGNLTRVSKRESWNEWVKLRLLKRTVGKRDGAQRDERGFGRRLIDGHFVRLPVQKNDTPAALEGNSHSSYIQLELWHSASQLDSKHISPFTAPSLAVFDVKTLQCHFGFRDEDEWPLQACFKPAPLH